MGPDERRTTALFRLDLVIALCALAISTLACVATIVQARVIGQQLSATVWPYLDFGISSTSNTGKAKGQDESSITVTNDGLGPAIIQTVTVSLDGHDLPSFDSAIARIVPAQRTVAGSTSSSNISTGSVIRSGESVLLMDIKGSAMVTPFRARLPRLGIGICYCSILRTCWLVRIHEAPRDIVSCAS